MMLAPDSTNFMAPLSVRSRGIMSGRVWQWQFVVRAADAHKVEHWG
jgi:hypothetical protein